MRRLLPLRKQSKLPLYHSEEERDALRAAGSFNAQLMDYLRPWVRPGVTTNKLDRLADNFTRDHGHLPACLGYNGFPKTICASVNDVVCHGIPDDRELRSGDIVNIDCTTVVDGWYGDSSETFLVGDVRPEIRRLVQAAFDAMWVGIRVADPYTSVMKIGIAISRFGRECGYSVVENFQGHGIGQMFHQDPGIPHVPIKKSRKDLLVPGVCFTIEPMLNLGTKETEGPLADGWTILTRDRLPSAQFEHQILMTELGAEILTMTEHGPQEGHLFGG